MSRTAVTSEDKTPDDLAQADAWLDGLAGRGGESASAQDGARLRGAILPAPRTGSDNNEPPPWHDVVAKAGQPVAATPTVQAMAAANDGQWKRRAGAMLLLALMLGAGVWKFVAPGDANVPVLRGIPTAAGAVWEMPNPAEAARDLARRLEIAGGRVTTTATTEGVVMEVTCAAAACLTVNEQLGLIDLAVDATGRLSLKVLAPSQAK